MMTKHGQVRIGQTPSVLSGSPAEQICDGEPLRHDEAETPDTIRLKQANFEPTPPKENQQHEQPA